ncbi:hypothetical protein [Aureivirga sp. CE67]|uniref:hypothetical protein n=1 Tax=Aureivirga sp. CE67 TaxID=1788983 RepID=UPI0018CA0165|nr:hypothetical protein [Aureivirga sp. CE67]
MELLHTSTYFSSYQDAENQLFYIDFGNKIVTLTFHEFLHLKHKIRFMSSPRYLELVINSRNIEILTLCNRKHLFILDVPQILDLQNLVQNTCQIFEAESLVLA